MDVGYGSQRDFVSVLLHFQFSLNFCTNVVFGSERGIAEIVYSSIYMVIPSASIWICSRKLRIVTSLEFLLLLLAGFKIRLPCMNFSHFPSQDEDFMHKHRLEVQYKAEGESHFKLEISNVVVQNCLNLWSKCLVCFERRSFVGLFSQSLVCASDIV